MAKYSYEFKKKVVLDYINGVGGRRYLSEKYNIPSKTVIKTWIDNYRAFGDDGLKRSRTRADYSFEMKLSIVELYLTTELSYQDIALQFQITNPSIICSWVNRYRSLGPEGLKPIRKGRRNMKNKPSKGVLPKSASRKMNDQQEQIQALEAEILKLRIENAFLKESRRLRLEEEAKMRERRESSSVSEDPSN